MDVMNVSTNARIVVLNVSKEGVIDVKKDGNGNLRLLDVNQYVEMDWEWKLKYVMIRFTNWGMSVKLASSNVQITVICAITGFAYHVIWAIN